MTFPQTASLHQAPDCFYPRWQSVNDWLVAQADFWRPAPFMEPNPAWSLAYPELADWLENLSEQDCETYQQQLPQLVDGLSRWLPALNRYRELVALPGLAGADAGRDAALPEVVAVDMPGRKRLQAGAFMAAVAPLTHPVLDWCCGKGHLSRTLARQGDIGVLGWEWNPALVDDGNRLAGRFQDSVRLCTQDVMAPELIWPKGRQGVALHACGDLHRRLMVLGSAAGAPRLSFSPCCYHLTAAGSYTPMAARTRAYPGRLEVSQSELRLAVRETVTAPARVRLQTGQASAWRLGFDALQRALTGNQTYLSVPSHPVRLNAEGFEAFCRWAAERKQLALPASVDWVHWEHQGYQRHRQVRRHELLRHVFRRPLELWMVLDYAVYLEEQGYRVSLGRFCDRSLTPRNLLLDAVRG